MVLSGETHILITPGESYGILFMRLRPLKSNGVCRRPMERRGNTPSETPRIRSKTPLVCSLFKQFSAR